VDALRLRRGMRVLEIGCGPGAAEGGNPLKEVQL
jgi:hypothetical protein